MFVGGSANTTSSASYGCGLEVSNSTFSAVSTVMVFGLARIMDGERMNNLIIVLPYIPVRELSLNASRRCPEGLKIKLRQELRDIAYYCIIDARNKWEKTEHREWETLEKAKLFYTFVFPVKRQHDADNLISAMKVALDQLVEAEIIKDDNVKALKIMQPVVKVSQELAPLTIMEVKGG